jgi:hypothetical protein
MRRQALALIIQPFKNRLMPREQLKEAADECVGQLLALVGAFPNIRFNFVLPGSVLERIDPFALSQLRDASRRGTIEWLITGYSEPFLSLSPPWLTTANIRCALETLNEHLGCQASGYLPPFSNWDPHYIELLRAQALEYVVVDQAQLPPSCRTMLGCWVTEQLGASVTLVPAHTLHAYSAPSNVAQWLDTHFERDERENGNTKLLGLRFLLPLELADQPTGFAWLRELAQTAENRVLQYQTVRISDYLFDTPPQGLQYLHPSITLNDGQTEVGSNFRNWLFCHDQVGILHRKLLEVCDMLTARSSARQIEPLLKTLFAAQDINRFLPATGTGFESVADRCWSYRTLLGLEERMHAEDKLKGGQIRISEYLRNGTKNIIMLNKGLQVYIDYRTGGTIFEMDVLARHYNALALYARRNPGEPKLIAPGESKSAFCDHLLPPGMSAEEFFSPTRTELGDFHQGRFDYAVKKSATDVKTILTRNGALLQREKNCPLTMEKVFGIEGERAKLSFAYKLTNSTLAEYAFDFALELPLLLPGAVEGKARMGCAQGVWRNLGWERVVLEGVTELYCEDSSIGVRIELTMPKPMTVWCYPLGGGSADHPDYQGTVLVLSQGVVLTENSSWSLMGKLTFRKSRRARGAADAL